MAIQKNRVLRRLILSWRDDGTFEGGQADYVDVFADDATTEVVGRVDKVGEPIAGALQPGTPVDSVLSASEIQRAASLVSEQQRADTAEARVRELETEADRTR